MSLFSQNSPSREEASFSIQLVRTVDETLTLYFSDGEDKLKVFLIDAHLMCLLRDVSHNKYLFTAKPLFFPCTDTKDSVLVYTITGHFCHFIISPLTSFDFICLASSFIQSRKTLRQRSAHSLSII